VALGLKLRITNTRDNTSFERTFDRFPVRIGRNQLNDLQLDYPFVSQFHNVLELNGQKLMLRDLGSKNGTLLRGTGRVPPNTVVDLAATNYEFAIVTLIFQAFAVNVEPQQQQPRKRAGTVLAMSMAEASQLMTSPGPPGGPPPGPPKVPVPGALPSMPPPPPVVGDPHAHLTAQLRPLYEAYRASWAQLYGAIYNMTAQLDPQARTMVFKRIVQENPAVANEQDFQKLAGHYGAPVGPPSGSGPASKEESVAFQGLKELATWYLPGGRPLENVTDVVGFLQKLQDTLDVFLKCFVPLRDGYKQFETQMEIKKTYRPGMPTQGISVETARDPRELAGRLLDWRDPSPEPQRVVESTFADLMIHQVAMLSGVMKGVKSLLSELSPQTIERALEDPKKRSGGIQVGPFRYKALWELYAERHSDLADEEKEAFALIFGPQFVATYKQLADEGVGPSRGTQAQQALPSGAHAAFPNPAGPYGRPPR
jgi:type VI secretion system protein ImpI